MNTFNYMNSFWFCLVFPCVLLCQEFYPGFLSQMDAPICHNTSTLLSFETLPSGGDLEDYTYQWQISWDQESWFDLTNATSINYTTDILSDDTYYSVVVTYQGVSISTNTVAVYVLPPLVTGVLTEVDSMCSNEPTAISFEIPPSGAEFNWGGFSEFSYQWQQGNISELDNDLTIVNWLNVGNDEDIHIPYLVPGRYCFRCIITSPHGCGTVLTDPIFVQINDCFNAEVEEIENKKEIIQTFNILGQNNAQQSWFINIYNNGFVEKIYKP